MCIIFAGLLSWAFILTYCACVSGFTFIFSNFFLIFVGFSTLRKDMYKILRYIPLFCRIFQEQQPSCWCPSVINLIGETFPHIVEIASLLATYK